ncbi:hypothetical protein VNO80_26882 [Phaseolus coccineus]|uniref:Uncharacterized protein n=1 Tax=Phaseolus coccineus TaxID=3886 RepID=A0AAN9LFK0_PHACN
MQRAIGRVIVASLWKSRWEKIKGRVLCEKYESSWSSCGVNDVVVIVEGVKLASSPSKAVTLGLQSITRIEIAKSIMNHKEMSMTEKEEGKG